MHVELESGVKLEPTYTYEVEYKAAGKHGADNSHVLDCASPFSASSLMEGEKYLFRVRVKQGVASGPWSNWSSALARRTINDLIHR